MQGLLFNLHYDYALFVDWDTYISPLSAPPLQAFVLQWPQKALYVQATDTFNAGVLTAAAASTYRDVHENACQSRIFLMFLMVRDVCHVELGMCRNTGVRCNATVALYCTP